MAKVKSIPLLELLLPAENEVSVADVRALNLTKATIILATAGHIRPFHTSDQSNNTSAQL